jgi:sterol desaturase/sphingolipid hydroxylase (fatty acid hydroxylase superfamily)
VVALNSFGFNLPWWDRLFGTWGAEPAGEHLAITIGIERFRNLRELTINRMLRQSLRGGTGRYPMLGQNP